MCSYDDLRRSEFREIESFLNPFVLVFECNEYNCFGINAYLIALLGVYGTRTK